MKTITISIALFATFITFAQDPLPPIGLWREHLPYNSAIDVAAGDGIVYGATPYSLFSVNLQDNMINRYSRITGLSETGISTIRYDVNADRLFIAYSNSNIDILYKNEVRNVPDIKRSTNPGDKQVYNITPVDRFCYLSTGIGIVVLDTEKEEVKDTWSIGQVGNAVKVTGFATDNLFYYAATAEGLKSISISSPNPSNAANWAVESGLNGLPPGPCSNVMSVGGRIIVAKNDSLFSGSAGNWTFLYADGWPLVNSNASSGAIFLCERMSSGTARVVQMDPAGAVTRIFANTGAVSFPRNAILYNNQTWIADQFASLSRFGAGPEYEQYMLNSPQGLASGDMTVANNRFYATAGAVNDSWNYQFNGDGIFSLMEGTWTNTNRYRYSQLDSLFDFITIAADPVDGSFFAGSYGGGLLHASPGPVFEIFKQQHLGETQGDPGSYRVSGLAFDRERNLWISNFGAASGLRVRKPDGSWKAFTVPFSLFENAMGEIVIDRQQYKWIVSPLGNGLLCFDHGNDIDNLNDDRWRQLSTGGGNGALPSSDVLSVTSDRNGYIWVGTADGVAVFQCPELIFAAEGCDAIRPIVPNGNFAGYLFGGQEVRDIAVDGADRKWMATRNGVFLVSATGEKVIYGFTEENSPLLSNDVKKVTIDGRTGEVFFATLKGICSFRSTATDANEPVNGVLVFPNPVPPGYSGTIGIRGLPADAIVKITELDGRLVYQAKTLGGQLVWNGINYKGQRVSSGVYLVLVTGPDGKEKNAAKIFFISK